MKHKKEAPKFDHNEKRNSPRLMKYYLYVSIFLEISKYFTTRASAFNRVECNSLQPPSAPVIDFFLMEEKQTNRERIHIV